MCVAQKLLTASIRILQGVYLPTTGTCTTSPDVSSPWWKSLVFLGYSEILPPPKEKKKEIMSKKGEKKEMEKKKKANLGKKAEARELRTYWPRKKKSSRGRTVVHSNVIGCLVLRATWSAESETRTLFLKQNKAGILSNDCMSPVPLMQGDKGSDFLCGLCIIHNF